MPSPEEVGCTRSTCSAFKVVGAGNIYRHGRTAAGEPRFRCTTCGGTFTVTTGRATQRFRHQRSKILEGAGLVIFGGDSLRVAAEEVGVAPSTVARWVNAARTSAEFMAEVKQARIDAASADLRTIIRVGSDLGFINAGEVDAILTGDRALSQRLYRNLKEHFGSARALLLALQPEPLPTIPD